MKNLFWLIPVFFISCAAGNEGADSGPESYITISGIVIDSEKNEPITGAKVIAGNRTTLTDSSGNYSIKVPESNSFDVFGVWKGVSTQPLLFFNWDKPEKDTTWNLITTVNSGANPEHSFEITLKDRNGSPLVSQNVFCYFTNKISRLHYSSSSGSYTTDGEGIFHQIFFRCKPAHPERFHSLKLLNA